MTIKVQGEVYDSPEEVITAIGKLSVTLEDMPESSKERADLERHILRLKDAVSPSAEVALPLPGDAADKPGADSTLAAAEDSPPETPDAEAEHDPDDDPVPPGYKLCPVCAGGGMLTEEAPISQEWEQCDACRGYGKTLTGSHVAGHETKDCGSCQGQGFIARRGQHREPTNGHTPAPAPAWPGSWWNETESRWEPPAGEPPWSGAEWDHVKGAYL